MRLTKSTKLLQRLTDDNRCCDTSYCAGLFLNLSVFGIDSKTAFPFLQAPPMKVDSKSYDINYGLFGMDA